MSDAHSDDIRDVDGRTAASVVHPRLTSLPSTVTIAEMRAYFAASSSRRLATLLDDDGCYKTRTRFCGLGEAH